MLVFTLLWLIILGIIKFKLRDKSIHKSRDKPSTNRQVLQVETVSNPLVDALSEQIDAVCEFALVLDKASAKASREGDKQKSAQLRARAANEYTKAAKIQLQLDKLLSNP